MNRVLTRSRDWIGGSENASDPRVVVGGPIRTAKDHHFQQVWQIICKWVILPCHVCLREGTNRQIGTFRGLAQGLEW